MSPLPCPKEPLTISLQFILFFYLSYQPFISLYFAIHANRIYISLHFPLLFIAFTSPHWFSLS